MNQNQNNRVFDIFDEPYGRYRKTVEQAESFVFVALYTPVLLAVTLLEQQCMNGNILFATKIKRLKTRSPECFRPHFRLNLLVQ